MDPLFLTIGWIIGGLSLVFGVLASYYMYKISRIYGGELGASLKKMCIGTILILTGLIILGGILTMITLENPESNILDALVYVTIFTVPGFLAMLIGARNLGKVAGK